MQYSNIDLSEAPSPAFAMCSYISGVEFGTYSGGAFSWKDKHREEDLLELHIFDETKEFRAVLSGCKFIKALISEEKDQEYLDEYMRLFGEEYKNAKSNITILTDKGHSKEFYINITGEQFKKGITLGVRNYIKYDENDMIQIVNYRLLGLFSGKTDEEKEMISYA